MLPEPIASEPLLLGALLVVLAVLLAYQRTLSWSEYRLIHRAKVLLFPILQTKVNVLLVSSKGYRAGEYLTTVDDSVSGVFKSLVRSGGSPHLICSVKERETPEGQRQYSAAHVVWLHNDGSQTEAYVFEAPDGGVDVQAHHEPGVLDAEAHLDGSNQTDGDPRGVVWSALAEKYGVDESG